MTTGIVARLARHKNEVERDRAIYRVLCGCRDCGEEIAKMHAGDWVHTYTGGLPSPLVFSPGWLEGDDGIWRLTHHAANRLRHAQRTASGFEDGTGRVTRERERLSNGTVRGTRRPVPRMADPDGLFDAWLPCQAQCSRCREINDVPLTLVTEALERWLQERDRQSGGPPQRSAV